jgi:hypothetical protein
MFRLCVGFVASFNRYIQSVHSSHCSKARVVVGGGGYVLGSLLSGLLYIQTPSSLPPFPSGPGGDSDSGARRLGSDPVEFVERNRLSACAFRLPSGGWIWQDCGDPSSCRPCLTGPFPFLYPGPNHSVSPGPHAFQSPPPPPLHTHRLYC